MVTHIVFFAFHPENIEEHLTEAKRRIEAMADTIPSLRHLEVGINFSEEERAMDMALLTRFEDRAGLEAYAVNPVHQEVIAYISNVARYTKVVDYES